MSKKPSEKTLHSFSGDCLVCMPEQNWISFRLVDEHGDGSPYAGLRYRLVMTALYAPDGRWPDSWEPLPGETPETHFARIERQGQTLH